MAQRTGKVPKAIQNKPKPGRRERWLLNAFATLSSTRNGSSPIKISEMLAYSKLLGIILDPEEFVEIIQAMDSEFMKTINK